MNMEYRVAKQSCTILTPALQDLEQSTKISHLSFVQELANQSIMVQFRLIIILYVWNKWQYMGCDIEESVVS